VEKLSGGDNFVALARFQFPRARQRAATAGYQRQCQAG
jgi:hypothetical protein